LILCCRSRAPTHIVVANRPDGDPTSFNVTRASPNPIDTATRRNGFVDVVLFFCALFLMRRETGSATPCTCAYETREANQVDAGLDRRSDQTQESYP
jgi:hypothetical protein